jgi:HEAT repeat protein
MTCDEIMNAFGGTVDPSERMNLIELLMELSLESWREAEGFLSMIVDSDPDPVVRHEAAFALGELRRSGEIGDAAGRNSLCNAALNDKSILVRHEAAEALYCFGGPQVDAVLQQLLDDQSDDIKSTAAISISWRQQLF